MSMESLGMPSFERREIVKPRIDYAVDRETCLRKLVSQAAGRQIDNFADEHLIEQINASANEVIDSETTLGCLTIGCKLTCAVTNERGILHEVDGSVNGLCLETSLSIGRAVLGK